MTYHLKDTLDQTIHYGTFYNNDYYFLNSSGEFCDTCHPLLFETYNYQSSLLKFNSDLVLIDSIPIDSAFGYLFNARKLQFFQDTLIVVGRAIKQDISDEQIFISRYSSDLELINTSLIGEENRLEVVSDFIMNHQGNLIIPSIVYHPNWEESYFILYECTRNGVVLTMKTDSLWNTGGLRGIQLEGSKAYQFANAYNVSIYDSSLNHIVTEVPDFYNSFINLSLMTSMSDDAYFTGGVKILVNKSAGDIPRSDDYDLVVSYYLIDEEANGLDFGYIDLREYECWAGGLDFLEPNTLCYGGIQNYNFSNGVYSPGNNWIIATNINYIDQTENWLFRYGGDTHYDMKGLFLTPDNECIIYSTIFDWENTDRLERDILIMKIDSAGGLVDVNTSLEKRNNFNIYPNPGTNSFVVETDELYGTLTLYALDGKSKLQVPILNTQTKIVTEGLNPGVYFYTVTDSNHIMIGKGKWIKQ